MASRQAHTAKRPTALWDMLCLVILIITVATANTPALANGSSPPSVLVVYPHQNRVPPNNTIVFVASPSGKPSLSEFGSIAVVANPLRESEAADSPVLGQQDGQIIVEKDLSLTFLFTYVLNTATFTGSITTQGVVDPLGNGELAITGGTYDFRGAKGYADLSLVTQENPQDVVYKTVLYIKYD